jgi:hypothetical protein
MAEIFVFILLPQNTVAQRILYCQSFVLFLWKEKPESQRIIEEIIGIRPLTI